MGAMIGVFLFFVLLVTITVIYETAEYIIGKLK